MRFKKIKKRFLEKRFNTLLLKPISKAKPVHEKVTTVGILCHDSFFNRLNLQEMISEAFDVRNSKIYSFRSYHKEHQSSYKHFSENDFDWKGNITDTSLDTFLDTEFDLLITFFDKNNTYIEYVTLLSKASFKVGYAGVNQALFDLEIEFKNIEIQHYLEETKKYLKILNKL
ncbi:MAG: hypothetical protein JXQ93_05200 [Flavobacteriaceae bacterium]